MTNQQALTKSNGTGMAVWGERGDVRELEVRLREMLPGADRLTPSQRLALAQASLAHGLDPFNGELWLIPGRGLMIGVKGLRKKAHEQVKGNYWAEFVEITDADYRARQRIPEKALAYECRLFDSENLRTYANTCEQLLKAGIPWEAVREMVGAKPYTVGIGVLAAGEQTKMQPAQCAMKRAEADAIKRRFDVPFGITVNPDQDAPESGEWAVTDNVVEMVSESDGADTPEPEPTPERSAYTAKAKAQLWPEEDIVPPAPVVPVTTPEPDLSGLVDTRPPQPAPVKAISTASMKVRDSAKAKAWTAWGEAFAKRFPAYQTPNGKASFFHILGAAKKCLFDAVTDDNMGDVMKAIEARAAEQQDAPSN